MMKHQPAAFRLPQPALRVAAWREMFSCRGASTAVEFALIAPILAMLFICTVDLALGFYEKIQVQNAAQAGAEYAVRHGFDATSISHAVLAATALSGISVSPAPTEFCGCASTTGIAAASCGSTCSTGAAAGTYVSVSAQATYSTLFSYPGLPATFAFTAQSTVRIQ